MSRGEIGMAAVVGLLVTGLAVIFWPHDEPMPLSPGPQSSSRPASVPTRPGHNLAVTRAEITHLFSTVPLPSGATRSDTHAPYLDDMHAGIGEFDPELVRTGFWLVPLAYGDLARWYDDSSPALIARTGLPNPRPRGYLWWTIKTVSSAYFLPLVSISYAQVDDKHTEIRVDVGAHSRIDRTAQGFVPAAQVTSIEVAITDYDEEAPGRTITDPAVARRVADAFNGLYGSDAHGSHSGACGSPFGGAHVYSVAFHWPGHTMRALGNFCRDDRRLVLDGRQVRSRLADDDEFDAVLAAALNS